MAAWHLRRFLDQVKPSIVLIEGLDDAADLIADMTRRSVRPPIAILAYTDSLPVRTLVYPMAAYSPEYQAIVWAREHRAAVEYIDLPSAAFLGLEDAAEERAAAAREQAAQEAEAAEEAVTEEAAEETAPAPVEPGQLEPRLSIYDQVARLAGERDYDTFWERRFEHNLAEDSYRRAAIEFGTSLRDLDERQPERHAETLVREAYMRRRIAQAIEAGHDPARIVAVVGAFHAPVLTGDEPAMTDSELASLPRRPSKLTLMPYSYLKLSTQSGYGAGNRAPAYFELLWDSLNEAEGEEGLADLPLRYLSLVARQMRKSGTHRSTAEVIDGVRLARALSAFYDGQAPTLADLHDAAVALLGQGQRSAVKEALVKVDVGTRIGALPKGVSQTSIQEDFDRQIARLKLEKFKTPVKTELALDLRENRQAKGRQAAFLDLDRSGFFHQLRVLEIGFAVPLASRQQAANWAERWEVYWDAECEIALVEAVLLGETVELAAAYKIKTRLDECESIAEAAQLVREACQCGLMASMELARQRLQGLAAVAVDFAAVAHAAWQLTLVVRYGDVRRFDPTPLLPLVDELFVNGTLSLFSAANCDNQAAASLLPAVDELNNVGLEFAHRVDEPMWIGQLQRLADADDKNSLLSGYACAILLERGLVANDVLEREVSRRLSPGVPADLGAGWFEGLSQRNRYALLARQPLWEQLDLYIASLDDDQFRRALVFLRRAFGTFSLQEKRLIGENLGHCWGLAPDAATELADAPLTEQEEKQLGELNEFDFGDL
jgi:hypothetical protein